MTEQEIRDNAPSCATHYKKYDGYENLISYYKVSFIKIGRGYPDIKEQFLWYQDKWVYCTPLSDDIKPLP